MEYLTLQDIPYRQYNPSHAHRMANSHTSEGPLGNMNTAVRHPISYSNYYDRKLVARFMPYAFCLRSSHRTSDSGIFVADSGANQELIAAQNIRSSPPIQPGEAGYADKLPSFSEVCNKHHNQAL
jgi:hypothetical protein